MNRARRGGLAAAAALALLPCVGGAVQSDDADDQALAADADYVGGLAALKAGDAASAVQRFRAAHSLSGAMGFGHRDPNWEDPRTAEFARVVGEGYKGGPCDLYALAQKNQAAGTLPELRIDCGTEDFLLEDNRAFNTFLTEQGIVHEYEEFPGAHTWEYWDRHIQDALKFFFPLTP